MQSGPNCKKLVGRLRPKPLKTRACALWLCRIPATFDLLASPEKQKRNAPVPVKLLRTASDAGAVLSFWAFFLSGIFLFWQVVANENARPELTARVENMKEYDTVIVAFPNWWTTMPMACLPSWKATISPARPSAC